MSDAIITVEGLSKRYILGQNRAKGDGLRHAIENAVKAPFRALKSGKNVRDSDPSEFWALRDVSFSVKTGEVLGVIGRNGAGKSTLLKLLSRITEPTNGSITMKGRIASLLEVGTGFHPELTGRENVYLNGAILGMTRSEIRRKFDEIVAFAGVERFLDTPVKRYSSGMYVRLAFGVAAHLEPEILIVDEVLAVGDSAFQKKCLGKMDEVAKNGRTVLFVSHNMAMMSNLCTRAIMLRKGNIVADGVTRDVIDEYLAESSGLREVALADRKDRTGSGEVIATKIEILDGSGREQAHVETGQKVVVRLHYSCRNTHHRMECRAIIIVRRGEEYRFALSTRQTASGDVHFAGDGYVDFVIPHLPLTDGKYSLDVSLESQMVHDVIADAAEMSVVDGDFFGTGRVLPAENWKDPGVLIPHQLRFAPKSVEAVPAI